jgi:hypothetical protein
MSTGRAGTLVALGSVGVAVLAVVGALWFLVVGIDDSGGDDDAVRVLLIGDSIMNQAAQHIERVLESNEQVGAVEVRNEGRNGTGLLTPTIFDWQEATPGLLEEFRPDVVVVLFVGNYSSTDLWVNEGGLEVEGYSDQFFRSWESEARKLQQQLTASGADIYWVNPPPMLADEGERRVRSFRLIHRRIAENWTNTVLIDGTGVLSDDEGNYAYELPDDDGVPTPVRTADSVHLTREGAELLAGEIARQITPSVLVAQRRHAEDSR